MEGPLQMVFHGALIAVVLFAVMRFVLKQSDSKSMTRAVFAGLVVALYMVMFGHGPPGHVNSNLF
jgi:hypothetical protein